MSNPYERRGRHLEAPPPHSEDDGSSSAQASDYDQDANTHQGHYDYPHSTQQPSQQSIENQVYYSDEQYGSSDENSSDYLELESDSFDDTAEDMHNVADDYPLHGLDTVEGKSENPPLYPHQVPHSHPIQGSYPPVGTAPVTETFASPDFTSWDARPGRSQPYDPSRAAGTWGRDRGLPALPDYMPNPFGSVEQPVTWFERPATANESALSLELARTTQPDPQQYPAVCLPGETMLPRAPLRPSGWKKDWNNHELRQLRRWEAEHGPNNWAGVEEVITTRSARACQAKWESLSKDSLDNELRGHHQGGGAARSSSGARQYQRKGRAKKLSEDDISFVKCQLAENIPVKEIFSQDRFSDYSGPDALMNAVRRHGWSAWTPEEDRQVLELQEQEGDGWAQISSKPNGKSRTRDEVITRHLFLGGQSNKIRRRRRGRGPSAHNRWSLEDDMDLGLEAARGTSWADMSRGVFTGRKKVDIGTRARNLRVNWTREDDLKLWDMNLEPGATLDWKSVGRQWDPEREGLHVKERWEFLQRRSRGRRDSHPQPPMSTYRSLTHTAPGQLNEEDDARLREALATGASFQDIKDSMFSNRFDLSPDILAARAREINAEWSPQEDPALFPTSEADDRPYYTSGHPTTDPDHAPPPPPLQYQRDANVYITQEEFENIKRWIARGYGYESIGAKCDPQRTTMAIQKLLSRRKYKRWTHEQDNHLIVLQLENNINLAEIRRNLPGPERTEEEISERLDFLREGRPYRWHGWKLERQD